MATLNADNYQLSRVDEPSSKINVKDQHGRVRRLADRITLSAELALNDIIKAGVLPAGAKIVDARFVAPTDGTSGQYDFGWASNGTDAADQDGLFAGATELDTGAGAVDAKILGTAAGYNKEFANAETELEILVVEATTASSGDLLQWEVYYVVD